jgi:hypothetical protein
MRCPALFLPLLSEELDHADHAGMASVVAELGVRGVRVRRASGAPVALEATFERWASLGDPDTGLDEASLELLDEAFSASRAVLALGDRTSRVYVGAEAIAYAPGDPWPRLAEVALLMGPVLAHLVAAVAQANEAPSPESRARMMAAHERHQRWQAR